MSPPPTLFFFFVTFLPFQGAISVGGWPSAAPLLRYTLYVLTWVMYSTKHQLIFINMGTRQPLAVRGCGWSKHFTLVIERMMECLGGGTPDVYRGLGVSLVPLSADAIVRSRNGWRYKLTYYQQRFRTPSVFPSVWGSNGAQVGRALEWVGLQWFSRKVSPWWVL